MKNIFVSAYRVGTTRKNTTSFFQSTPLQKYILYNFSREVIINPTTESSDPHLGDVHV